MESRIIRFLNHHHVLTLSTTSESGSWTAHCFYAFIPERQSLVFTSAHDTRHGREVLQNQRVSGGIMLETKVIGMIRGIQLTGTVFPVGDDGDSLEPVARTAYLKKFPFAIATKLDLWVLQIDYLKMTDNRLGFGKKLEWRSGEHEL